MHAIKGSQTIIEYMQFIKCHAYQLAAFGIPLNDEDPINKILDSLDDDYKTITDIVQNCETPILFDELHEKLINRELALKHLSSDHSLLPVIANMTSGCPANIYHPSNSRSTGCHLALGPLASFRHLTPTSSQRQPRPYLGWCQGCRTVGHSVSQCLIYQLVLTSTTRAPAHPHARPFSAPHHYQWQPMAHVATSSTTKSPPWSLDNGASHHVTVDINNLTLHAPYDGLDDIIIGDGTRLHITHSGTTCLYTPSNSFTLHNVLCVPHMKRNPIFIS